MRFFVILLMSVVCVGVACAQDYSPRQIDQMPSLAMQRHGAGTLKVCSKPLEVAVYFQGQALRKNRAVLTEDDVKPGLYDVVFEGGGKRLIKKARIVPGETTIIFGSLDSPEAKSAQEVAIPASAPAQEPMAAIPVTDANPPLVAGGSLVGTGAEGLHDMKDAEIAFEYAELLRNAFNPFTASSRYSKALDLYRRIWEKFPDSIRVEMAHYYSGRIYESMHIKDYAAAIEQYRTVLVINPQTTTDAAQRIADLYGGVFKQQAQSQLGGVPQNSQQPSQQFTPRLDKGGAPDTVYSAQTGWQPQAVKPVVPQQGEFDGVTLQP